MSETSGGTSGGTDPADSPALPADAYGVLVDLIVRDIGDQESWRNVYSACRGRFTAHLCRKYPWLGAEADDVFQNVCHNAIRAIRNGSCPDNPRAWLAKTVNNEIAHCVRRLMTRKDQIRILSELGSSDQVAVDASASLDDHMFDDSKEYLWSMVATLPHNQRFVIEKHYKEKRSYGEIAAMIDMSVNAVKSLRQRALQRLRDMLGDSPNV